MMEKTKNNMPHISCIIPAYNEGKYIGRLLKSISEAQSSYHGGKDKIEIIVADNCSTGDT